jgi:hypothetical protein
MNDKEYHGTDRYGCDGKEQHTKLYFKAALTNNVRTWTIPKKTPVNGCG